MMNVSGHTRAWALGVIFLAAPILGGCAGNGAKTNTQTADANKPQAEAESLAGLRTYAKAGDIGAQFDLGLSLTETDFKAASTWLERAALQGYGPAAHQLGLLQDDPKRAVEWYSMASAMGHVASQYEMGNAYLNGRGTAKEPGWGLMWVERAARAGNGDAQFTMGQAMAKGLVGPAQRGEALVWLLIAAGNGGADAEPIIEDIKARLSTETIATAELRAGAWTNEPETDGLEDRAALRFAQYALARLGYDAGPADGISGDLTQTAIAAFRAQQDMRAGGLDGRMLDRLRERLALLKR